jgi:acyl-CoA synthetase (AMP-forming)/AMP-acid ligase II
MHHRPNQCSAIDATIQGLTRGRCVAISVADEGTEKPVTIIELKNRVHPDEDLIVVPLGSIPMATSGEVRRGACVEEYRRTSSPASTFRYHHEH